MAEIHDAKSRATPRGAVKEFKAYLNGLPGEKHRHFRFHQRKRGYGDYLYAQDHEKFMVDLRAWLAAREQESPSAPSATPA